MGANVFLRNWAFNQQHCLWVIWMWPIVSCNRSQVKQHPVPIQDELSHKICTAKRFNSSQVYNMWCSLMTNTAPALIWSCRVDPSLSNNLLDVSLDAIVWLGWCDVISIKVSKVAMTLYYYICRNRVETLYRVDTLWPYEAWSTYNW